MVNQPLKHLGETYVVVPKDNDQLRAIRDRLEELGASAYIFRHSIEFRGADHENASIDEHGEAVDHMHDLLDSWDDVDYWTRLPSY